MALSTTEKEPEVPGDISMFKALTHSLLIADQVAKKTALDDVLGTVYRAPGRHSSSVSIARLPAIQK